MEGASTDYRYDFGARLFPSFKRGVADKPLGLADGVLGNIIHTMEEIKFKENRIKLPTNPRLKQLAKELRKQGILSEVLFWNAVKQKKIFGLDFDRQKIIGNYIVDFYIKKLGIVIEIDGVSHNEKLELDITRDNYLSSLGIRVIRFTDSEIKFNLDGAISNLKFIIQSEFII